MLNPRACASVQTLEMAPSRTEQVRERNYELGKQRTVVVGEPLVRVREYQSKTRDGAGYLVKSDATGRVGMVTVAVQEGQTLPVVGERDIEGVPYRIDGQRDGAAGGPGRKHSKQGRDTPPERVWLDTRNPQPKL